MATRPAKGALNDQHELFCLEYLKDLNGTKAAERAGYSAKSAAQQASRLLTNAKITDRITALKAQQFETVQVDANVILRELLRLATVDLGGAYDDEGKLLPIKKMPEDVRRAIAGIEVFEEYEGSGKDREYIGDTVKVKIFDKNRSLELLGKHLKLFTDRVELGQETLEALITGSLVSKKAEK